MPHSLQVQYEMEQSRHSRQTTVLSHTLVTDRPARMREARSIRSGGRMRPRLPRTRPHRTDQVPSRYIGLGYPSFSQSLFRVNSPRSVPFRVCLFLQPPRDQVIFPILMDTQCILQIASWTRSLPHSFGGTHDDPPPRYETVVKSMG